MKRLFAIAVGSLTAAGLIWVVTSSTAFAQTPTPGNTGQALEIAPPVLDIRGDPGEIVKAQISLRDVSPTSLLVKNEINDFTAAGEDGTPKILVEDGEVSPYSIKNWISPLPQITLKPKEVQKLTVNVTIPKNAAPGGYFGVIRFTAEAPDPTQTGVSLSASLGTLVLLRVNGTAKESMNVEEFYASSAGNRGSLFESAPIQFFERIKNTGNVHEQPRGQITINDMFGQKLANLNVNLENRNVLPGTIRKFEQPLDETVIGNKILFGRYTADLQITYAGGQQATASLTFWVIPYKLIAIVVVSLLILFFAIRYALRRYTESVLDRSRRSRRR
ncbi:hypothetical protein KA093_00020 [Candidatus Saccharibacteria bacterium]|nr:hypothetical protein [Candidatus Saccharibacteria bacterium]